MSEDLLLSVAALLLAGNLWFLRRLVLSLDTFKTNVYAELKEHGLQLESIATRHRLEDGGAPVFLHRRATDA